MCHYNAPLKKLFLISYIICVFCLRFITYFKVNKLLTCYYNKTFYFKINSLVNRVTMITFQRFFVEFCLINVQISSK